MKRTEFVKVKDEMTLKVQDKHAKYDEDRRRFKLLQLKVKEGAGQSCDVCFYVCCYVSFYAFFYVHRCVL